MSHECKYYATLSREYVECELCPLSCHIIPAGFGLCGVRKNRDAKLVLTNYGKISHLEKKSAMQLPLSTAFEDDIFLFVGSIGCNMKCPFCVNWQAAQAGVSTIVMSPRDLVGKALEGNVTGIAFTYNEPIVSIEYLMDVAHQAREENLKIAVASNGMVNPQPLEDLLAAIDVLLVDVKSWDAEFYRVECGGSKEVVMRTIISAQNNTHLEVSYLVIEGINDSDEMIKDFSVWLSSVSSHIPLHLVQFTPAFQFSDRTETTTVRLYQLQTIAHHFLKKVYVVDNEDTEGP